MTPDEFRVELLKEEDNGVYPVGISLTISRTTRPAYIGVSIDGREYLVNLIRIKRIIEAIDVLDGIS